MCLLSKCVFKCSLHMPDLYVCMMGVISGSNYEIEDHMRFYVIFHIICIMACMWRRTLFKHCD